MECFYSGGLFMRGKKDFFSLAYTDKKQMDKVFYSYHKHLPVDVEETCLDGKFAFAMYFSRAVNFSLCINSTSRCKAPESAGGMGIRLVYGFLFPCFIRTRKGIRRKSYEGTY